MQESIFMCIYTYIYLYSYLPYIHSCMLTCHTTFLCFWFCDNVFRMNASKLDEMMQILGQMLQGKYLYSDYITIQSLLPVQCWTSGPLVGPKSAKGAPLGPCTPHGLNRCESIQAFTCIYLNTDLYIFIYIYMYMCICMLIHNMQL